ncbi:MAG: exopolysaccharide biosynthesis protein [Acidobacteria bacterium]|nr:exopolysaccharide biosynthesis protein [Acidobacteriota bacterium]
MKAGFVDIHSHILPGIDDGSSSFEESLEMLKVAAASGTACIVGTPHANSQFTYDRAAAQVLIDQLRPLAPPDLEIELGCDFHLTYENVRQAIAAPGSFTIASGPYLLVEFSDFNIPPNTEAAFDQLQRAGLIPIVTHPERNPLLRDSTDRLRRWVDSGNYLQLTAQSILGRWGADARSSSLRWLNEGLVHFVASDAHDPEGRPPRLDAAFEFLSAQYGEELAGLLTIHHPAAVVAGYRLDAGPLPKPQIPKKWYQFWR